MPAFRPLRFVLLLPFLALAAGGADAAAVTGGVEAARESSGTAAVAAGIQVSEHSPPK